jgi:hypothetical protein
MTRRTLLLLAVLSIATAAQASWWPKLDTDYIPMTVGQTETVGVQAMWSGLVDYGFSPWHFTSDNPHIAFVEGGKEALNKPGSIKITAISPGTAHVRLRDAGPYATIVVAGNYPPPQIALSSRVVTPGQPVTLTAIFPYPAFFIWYEGSIGDHSNAFSGADVVTYTPPKAPGTYHVWLLVMTPTTTSMAETTIEVVEPRRRAARH